MNRNDALKLQGVLADHINALDAQRKAATKKADQKRLTRQIDAALRLYQKYKPPPYKPPKTPKEVKSGVCPCGRDIMIGERYSLSTTGPTTITRVCSGCRRQHEVELRATNEFKVVDWKAIDCSCGEPVYIRSEYAGHGFSGYRGRMSFDNSTYKNRTVNSTCRACGCKWVFKIRFVELKSGPNKGKTQRSFPEILVGRCAPCQRKVDDAEKVTEGAHDLD